MAHPDKFTFELPAEIIEQIVQKHMKSLEWKLPKEMRGERLRIVVGGDVIDDSPLVISAIYQVESRDMIYPVDARLSDDDYKMIADTMTRHQRDYLHKNPSISYYDDVDT